MFAEAVTLAHVARPIALARALDPRHYEIIIACDRRYAGFTGDGHWAQAELKSIPSSQFLGALSRGSPVYDLETLSAYVEDDARVIDTIRPDVVVGDFRLSLSVSARKAGVPYMAIANAYWSPLYQGQIPLPVLPMTRVLPISMASVLFGAAQPLAFAIHCRPMNQLRARHGLPSIGYNLRKVYTDSDHVLVPDVQELHPLPVAALATHTYLGPLLWSPRVSLPSWWDEPSDSSHPIVYVALGSSGSSEALIAVLRALESLPVRVIASTAGADDSIDVPKNARVAPYLPGDAATSRADLVICNGGSMTTQQALDAGVPVIGIASNMDQFFNMAPIQAQGAGITLRADRLSAKAIQVACEKLIATRRSGGGATQLRERMRNPGLSPAEAFSVALERLSLRNLPT